MEYFCDDYHTFIYETNFIIKKPVRSRCAIKPNQTKPKPPRCFF